MRKRILIISSVVLLVLLIFCTVYSQISYRSKLPVVTLELSRTYKFLSNLEGYGDVVENQTGAAYRYSTKIKFELDEFTGFAMFWHNGDKVGVDFPGVLCDVQEAYIQSIIHEDDGYYVTVGYNFNQSPVGQNAVVKMRKESQEFNCVLPTEAIRTDDGANYYIYLVQEEAGPWGKRYVVYREDVQLYIKDREYTAIARAGKLSMPVVVSSSTKLYDGAVVKFY